MEFLIDFYLNSSEYFSLQGLKVFEVVWKKTSEVGSLCKFPTGKRI